MTSLAWVGVPIMTITPRRATSKPCPIAFVATIVLICWSGG